MTAIKPYAPRAVNRALDPSAETGTAGVWASNNVSLYPSVFDTAVKHSGAQSYRTTRSASTPSQAVSSINMTPVATSGPSVPFRLVVVPGEVVSGAVYMRASGGPWNGRLVFQPKDASMVNVGTAVASPIVLVPANTWTRVPNENLTMPVGAAFLQVYATLNLSSGLTVGGEQVWTDSLIVNSGPAAAAYFDGSTPGCSWSGTPWQSQSVRAAQTPWTRWDGVSEQPLDVAGLWDGAALQSVDLRDVTIAA